MSLQINITQHKCMTCGHEWTHSTLHSLQGSWVDSAEPHFATDHLSHIISGPPYEDRFCYRCALRETRAHRYDRSASLPAAKKPSLDDLLK